MIRRPLFLLLLPLALAVLAACQDVPPQPETPYTGPVNVSVQAASTAFVRCGQEIPVTVTVTDARGRALSGFHLNFNVLEGGGRMSAARRSPTTEAWPGTSGRSAGRRT